MNTSTATTPKRKRRRFNPDRRFVKQIMRAKGVDETRAWAMFRMKRACAQLDYNQMVA